MTISNKNLQKFKEWKAMLTELLNQSTGIFKSVEMDAQAAMLSDITIKVKAETFKIMVVGQFKVGKSTFINALLGEEVLPAYAIPCTAVINEVKYGSVPRAVLHFKDPIQKELPEKLSVIAKAHIQKYRSGVPPLEVPVARLEEFVVIPDPDKKQEDSVAETPYEKVELFWPLPLCEDNVEIIDSPGLNENGIRTAITADYFPKADAVLFVLTSLAALAESDMKFIDQNIIRAGHEYIFFVFNRFHQIPEKERQRLVNYGKSKLQGKTKDMNYIFFVDSAHALEGKTSKNPSLVENSGLPRLEDLLTDFLTNKKGKIKLLQPVNRFKTYLEYTLESTIPGSLSMLDLSLEDIEKRLKAVRPMLENLETKKKHIAERIQNRIARLELTLEREFRSNLLEIIRQTPAWIDNMDLKTGFRIQAPKKSSEEIISEIIEKYQEKIGEQQNEWCDHQLTPLIITQVDDMKEEFKTGIDDFYFSLENVKNKISGNVDVDHLSEQGKVSNRERIFAAAAGLLLADFGAGIIGASFGFTKQFFIQMALQVTAVVTMIMIGIANPFTVIPVVLAIAFAGMFMGVDATVKKLKKETAKKIAQELHQTIDQIAQSQTREIVGQIITATAPIESSLDDEIAALNSQVATICEDIRNGEEQVQAKKDGLNAAVQQLQDINRKLNDLKILFEAD
ncbi:dynamin family protein [Mucilaginibacter angelicae]|uniref:Dynamin family protein n=1 Tax=Mucilaginibacter angelicae TaxID=869718 RepID=A0ABV6LHK1_9SPHI